MTISEAFDLMHLPRTASVAETRKKYYELAFHAHPDHNGGSADEFYNLNQAYLRVLDHIRSLPCPHCGGKKPLIRCKHCHGTGKRELQ